MRSCAKNPFRPEKVLSEIVSKEEKRKRIVCLCPKRTNCLGKGKGCEGSFEIMSAYQA